MKNRKRGKEANQRNNGRPASILTSLWFFALAFMLGVAEGKVYKYGLYYNVINNVTI